MCHSSGVPSGAHSCLTPPDAVTEQASAVSVEEEGVISGGLTPSRPGSTGLGARTLGSVPCEPYGWVPAFQLPSLDGCKRGSGSALSDVPSDSMVTFAPVPRRCPCATECRALDGGGLPQLWGQPSFTPAL